MTVKTTTLKHLYASVKMRTTKLFRAQTLATISQKYNLEVNYLVGLEVPDLICLMEEYGDLGFTLGVMSTNLLRGWKEFGCQTFSLSEEMLDLLACTKSPPLDELTPMPSSRTRSEYLDTLRNKTSDEIMDQWQVPYPTFAVEFPYPVATPQADGTIEHFSVVVVKPFMNHDKGAADWSVLYLTHEDIANGCVSMANGTAAINGLLTNLCVYLNDGGVKTRTGKRIGYDKAAKKAATKVNIWKLASVTSTGLPRGMARPFLESGDAPPKTFRIGKRFMVRGHWRNQVCGEGRKDRVRKWIKPHLKGPEEGAAFARVYEVT
jgi:hypothetical protein